MTKTEWQIFLTWASVFAGAYWWVVWNKMTLLQAWLLNW